MSSSKRQRRDYDSNNDKQTSIKPIDEDDYFEKATEFRLWLKEHKHKYFDELSSKDARYYFKKFVRKWNDNDLEAKYYKGLNSSQLEASDTTRYKWSFAKNVNKDELDSVRDSVDSMTALSRGDDKIKHKRRLQAIGPTMPDTFEKEEQYESERRQRKYEERKKKERREAMLDEVAPRETGREAAIAKKRALNAYHKRERSPDMEFNDADLMGGDDYHSRLAAERKAKEKREAKHAERHQQRVAPIQDKMKEFKAKEDATMAMFRRMAEEQKKRGGL